MRQHYKSEHWAPCRNQTPSWYDWKIVESDVKPEYTHTHTLWRCYKLYIHVQSFNIAKTFLLLSKLCFKTMRHSDSFIFLLNKPYNRKQSELIPFDRLTVPTRCLCCALFQLSLFVRYLSLTFYALIRMIAWWSSAGKDTTCMQFKCKVKNLRHPEAGLIMVKRFFSVKPPVVFCLSGTIHFDGIKPWAGDHYNTTVGKPAVDRKKCWKFMTTLSLYHKALKCS